MLRCLAAIAAVTLLAAGCGGGPQGSGVRAISGDMECTEVAEVVDEALLRGVHRRRRA